LIYGKLILYQAAKKLDVYVTCQ